MHTTKDIARAFAAVLLLASVCMSWINALVSPVRAQPANPIVIENQRTGFDEWQLGSGPGRSASLESPQHMLGYANAWSVNKGGQITFFVTVDVSQQYTMTIYRMGYYQGNGGRIVQTVGPLNAAPQPACPQDAQTGMSHCAWAPSYTLTVPSTWTTGVYIALLSNAAKRESHVTFVVRDDARKADILYQMPVLTHAAYNNYPDDGVSGKRLYDTNSFGPLTAYGTKRAVKVSLNRPHRVSAVSGGSMHASNYYWELQLIMWLEQQGYDVIYSTDIDTQERPERLKDFKVVMSGGHNEYWTREMVDAWAAARDAGTSLAFMGGNVMYWQTRLEADSAGRPNRVVVCFKDAAIDPNPNPLLKTHQFRDTPQTEQPIVGAMFAGFNLAESPAGVRDWVAVNTSHWAYADTGMRDGDKIPRVVGHEIDGVDPAYAMPISATFTLLASSPFTSAVAPVNARHSSTLYQAPSGAFVWSTGSLIWSWGLARPGFVDTRVQRITNNILRRMIAQPAPTATPTVTLTPSIAPTLTTSPTPELTPTPTLTSTPGPGSTATPRVTASSTPQTTATPQVFSPTLPRILLPVVSR
jgi:hypothetical protein